MQHNAEYKFGRQCRKMHVKDEFGRDTMKINSEMNAEQQMQEVSSSSLSYSPARKHGRASGRRCLSEPQKSWAGPLLYVEQRLLNCSRRFPCFHESSHRDDAPDVASVVPATDIKMFSTGGNVVKLSSQDRPPVAVRENLSAHCAHGAQDPDKNRISKE